jgi:rod shape-determining protein MreC
MPSNFSDSKIFKIFLAAIIFFLLFFLNSFGVFRPVQKVFWEISYPFQKTFYVSSNKVRFFFNFLVSISEMKKENEKLIKENNFLAAQVVLLADQKRENGILRQQLDLIQREKYDLESALIIGRDSFGPGSWIMIDKGEKDGIKKGMPVVVSDGILVGKISETYRDGAKATLLTDSSIFINAIDEETGARGIVKGEYGLGLTMSMVEQTSVLNVEDTIATSGLGGSEPKGLLIGKLQRIENSEDKLFQQAIVVPRIKYSDLEVVFVLKNSNQ